MNLSTLSCPIVSPTDLADQVLELGPAGIQPVQVLVHRELRERLPVRLVAMNVYRVNSVRRLVTN